MHTTTWKAALCTWKYLLFKGIFTHGSFISESVPIIRIGLEEILVLATDMTSFKLMERLQKCRQKICYV